MAESRISATTGAAARSADNAPSTVFRSNLARVERIANSNNGRRERISSATAASPFCWRMSQGSMPLGSTATKVWALKRWSSSNARSAAFCPAASPSNVKITSPPVPSSESSRRAILMWSVPKAVPQVATAVVIPARWQAITSV